MSLEYVGYLRLYTNSPCRLQIHWLRPPKLANAGSTSPHSIHTALEDWLINNVTDYTLPLHANIVGNSL